MNVETRQYEIITT